MIVEHVRNVLGFRDADHEETSPDAPRLAVTALTCSLVGQREEIRLVRGTRGSEWYGSETAIEEYYCNYGINPDFVPLLQGSGLSVTAVDGRDEVRMVERRDHPFFVGTLFQPQMRSGGESTHPVLQAFGAAVDLHR